MRFALASCALLRTQRTRWKGRKLLDQLHMEIKREQMETLLAPFSRLLSLLLKKVSNELIDLKASHAALLAANNEITNELTALRNDVTSHLHVYPITKVTGDK